jgi:hypothetical protein
MPTITSPFALALLLIVWAFRAHAFETNCTFPAPDTSEFYVSAPNIRSTLGIIWSSLGTIAACTYGVLHLNVPQQRNGKRPGGLGYLKWYWNSIRPSIDWTGLTIMFPELYTAIASGDLARARTIKKELIESVQTANLAREGGWSLTHGFFANMGGFAVRRKRASVDESLTPPIHLNGESLLALLKREHKSLIKAPLLSQADIED